MTGRRRIPASRRASKLAPKPEAIAPARPARLSLRRCLVTGARRPPAEMIRIVLDPDGVPVIDLAAKLPGRGCWVSATREALVRAQEKGLIRRALGGRPLARGDTDLADAAEALLVRRCLGLLGLARKAGDLAIGFESVKAWLDAGRAALLIQAADGSERQRRELRRRAAAIAVAELLTVEELGLALGRQNVVHAAVAGGHRADKLRAELARLKGFRAGVEAR